MIPSRRVTSENSSNIIKHFHTRISLWIEVCAQVNHRFRVNVPKFNMMNPEHTTSLDPTARIAHSASDSLGDLCFLVNVLPAAKTQINW
jgi:hypothetical protein